MSHELRDIIRQVKDRIDIVEVIGRSVVLKRAGASYKGKCPFHNEKSPSFNVVPAKQIFHCFGCGVGGSVIDYVMRLERLEFIEALAKLAKELGLELPSRGRPVDPALRREEDRQRQTLEDANKAALQWFRANLLKDRNPLASAYLPQRGITAEHSERFGLGAALDEWDALKRHLLTLDFTEETLVNAGLCVHSDRGTTYDRFRNRLIFPIWDVNGKVCGFGGRALIDEPHSPKYLNSAETDLYKKGRILYALNLARESIEKTGYAVICEGYMDVLMAHAHGFTQAVASLGTALTRDQAKLLKRYATRTYFLYDGDSAGQKAMLRGGGPLLEVGFDTRVITLGAEDDPDTFLRREGAAALQQRLDRAREFFDFAVEAHASQLDLRTLAGQAELVERLAPTLVSFDNDVMREGAISRLLGRIGGIPREALNHILAKARKEAERFSASSQDDRPRNGDPTRRDEEEGGSSAPGRDLDFLERGLLKVMLESVEGLELVRSHLRHEWVSDPRLEGWIFYLVDNDGFVNNLVEDAELSGDLPGERHVLTSLMAWDHPIGKDAVAAAQQLMIRLHERHQRALTAELLSLLHRDFITDEERQRLLSLYHNENTHRIHNAGRHLRTKDSAARHGRAGE